MHNPLTMKFEQYMAFSDSERLRLNALLRHPQQTYRRGEPILTEGQKVREIHLVLTGLAARSKTLKDGDRQLMAFLVPGDLSDLEVFVLEAMDHDILALTDTVCTVIPAHEIEELLGESSNITRALWWSTMTDSATLREWIVNHGLRAAHERLAHIFCELLVRYRIVGEAQDNSIPFPLSQDDLAQATGMTAVHVNRMLQQLRSEGLIELEGNVLQVLDFELLKEVALFHPSYLHLVRTERNDPAISNRLGDLVLPHQPGLLVDPAAAERPLTKGRD